VYFGATVCTYVRVSTFVHPAKAVEQNEMPFWGDTRVVPSNIYCIRQGPGPAREGKSETQFHRVVAYGHFTLAVVKVFIASILRAGRLRCVSKKVHPFGFHNN